MDKTTYATVVLMTATQPEFSRIWPEQVEVREIIRDIPALFDALRRTKPAYVGALADGEPCARLRGEQPRARDRQQPRARAEAVRSAFRVRRVSST